MIDLLGIYTAPGHQKVGLLPRIHKRLPIPEGCNGPRDQPINRSRRDIARQLFAL